MTNKNYKTDIHGVIASIRRQVEGLVMPNLTVLQGVLLERKGNVHEEDRRLEIEQQRVVTDAYAAAARLFTPEMAIDDIDTPRVAPYLALPNKRGQHHEN